MRPDPYDRARVRNGAHEKNKIRFLVYDAVGGGGTFFLFVDILEIGIGNQLVCLRVGLYIADCSDPMQQPVLLTAAILLGIHGHALCVCLLSLFRVKERYALAAVLLAWNSF